MGEWKEIISITIHGEPTAKGRPKFSRMGGFVRAVTPEKTVNYETLVKEVYARSYPESTPVSANIPLRMDIIAYFKIPQSASKKKHEQMKEGEIRPTKKPDRDNIEKIISDALNSIAYHDDSQIVEGETKKFYSEVPRVTVSIKQKGNNKI